MSFVLTACGGDKPPTAPQAAAETAPAQEQVARAHGAASDSYKDTAAINVDEETVRKGSEVFGRVCAQCHVVGVARAPQLYILQIMTPESIYRALTEGAMQVQAKDLSLDEKRAVAEYLAQRKMSGKQAEDTVAMCSGATAGFDRNEPPVLQGWGFDDASTHYIPNQVAGITRNNVRTLKLKWAFGFPNAVRARSQPAIAAGAIYVGSHEGTVYAFDRNTGCARWTFMAGSEVRTGIVVQPWTAGDEAADPLLFFGDLAGNAYALKAFTGELVWRVHMDDHPAAVLTGTPTLYGDTVYVPVSSLEEGQAGKPDYECCTFRGSMVALDAATGKEKWRRWFVDQPAVEQKDRERDDGRKHYGPSGVPMWSTAAVDVKRGQMYVTLGDNYSTPATSLSDAVVALALDTGDIRWSFQALENDAWNGSCDEHNRVNCPEEDGPDFDFGAGAALAKGADGREYVVAGQKSSTAWGLDPDTGKLVWKNQVGRGGVVAGIHFGIAAANNTMYVPVSDVPDGREYDVPARPGMYALDIATGEYRWQAPSANRCDGRLACHPGYSGAISATDDLVLAGANDGWLQAFDASTGEVVWEVDTAVPFETINDVEAKGGSMGGGAAPIAYDGLLIMNSGYGFAGKMPGNVLLVFEVDRGVAQ
ncbi:MAG: PQQ-binding-like beta-propeller repeat protein [Pseudomonadales bacterium]|nr:PQQ-binding-like beta-propeller repeat protein [Pseudomonadales bacterium]MCP5182532.1 PQQ-binding-like beta-propeller repeat protein [Pseudomonadales bacterium]